ncbi:phage tail domain-containing protein [Amycolatopsis umgeniensis]|uniref:Siphovirus-type tail component C-terminal domain-containing protein n=1 Tax=Amycolatopsis umgeniensis TaxID=336628 RepID=A0A841AZG8_9PSEU|nr:phage tail domain-containing protein [Amycolatopsis umgeniensis]MBB5852233.1 hypothetical protein [Amycolatopsis umgeniensis]
MGGEAVIESVLALPTYTVDGWAGNTVDGAGVEWWVTKEDGWSGGPGIRLDLSDRPQRDGSFDAPSFRTARVITLEGTAIAPDPDTREDAKNRIVAVLADGATLGSLVVAERTMTRRASVRLAAGVKIADTTPVSFDWSIQLTAPDPLRYGEEQQLTCGLPRPGAGIEFPLSFPLEFGEPGGGRLSLLNRGTTPAWPQWTIHGPCVRPVIRNDSADGRQLAFSLSLSAGDELKIDTAARTVTLGQMSRRAGLLPGSRWFGLPPGTTNITFDAFDDSTPAWLSVSWRDAWV